MHIGFWCVSESLSFSLFSLYQHKRWKHICFLACPKWRMNLDCFLLFRSRSVNMKHANNLSHFVVTAAAQRWWCISFLFAQISHISHSLCIADCCLTKLYGCKWCTYLFSLVSVLHALSSFNVQRSRFRLFSIFKPTYYSRTRWHYTYRTRPIQ